jgi:hypothetical protein
MSPWRIALLALALGPTTPGRDMPAGKAVVKAEDEAANEDPFAESRLAAGYQVAYRQARNEADAALKDGRARLFSFGMLGMSDLDPETGLGVEKIAGCVVTPEVLGRTEGNNDRVRAWVKQNGPAPNSLVRWKDDLSDLPAFFAAKAKAGATIPLRIGGPTLTSPDGRYTLRQVGTRVERGEPPKTRTVITVGLEVRERGDFLEVVTDDWGDGLTDLAWGPHGAPFAVIKIRQDDEPDFQILHLRPLDWLSGGELAWERYLKEHPEDK